MAVLGGVFAGLMGSSLRADEAEGSTALTIYSTAAPGAIPAEMYKPGLQQNTYGARWRQQIPGYAIVKQERSVDFAKRRLTIRFTDVASEIEPTTVRFSSLTDPDGTRVLEQNYEFDLVSTQKLMQKFLDREITVEKANGDRIDTFTGKLLSADGGIVLQNESGGVQVISGYSNIRFPELPGGLITKPTLVWDVVTSKPGIHQTRVTYETKAMTWWADYNIVFAPGKDANSGVLEIGAWVSIINQSGASFPEAKLKLVAGNVHRAPQQVSRVARQRARGSVAKMAMDSSGFAEKSFFEYHLYTLGRRTTLPNNSTKQIELFPAARNVPCEKVMVYYGQTGAYYGVFGSPMMDRNFGLQSNKKVDVYLRFKNEKAVGMGMPLPSGRIRVSKLDAADDSLEFIGEDTIDHTPKNEVVLIKLGSAFDVVGERRQVDFNVDSSRKTMTETIEIKLRNHKDEKVKVVVKENLYRWTNWEITQKSHSFKKIDSRTIHFPVEIEKDGEVTVSYSVKYSW
jgi:hypothetical protein